MADRDVPLSRERRRRQQGPTYDRYLPPLIGGSPGTPAVGWTDGGTALPSARKRPGPGCASRSGFRPPACDSARAARMTLLQRRSLARSTGSTTRTSSSRASATRAPAARRRRHSAPSTSAQVAGTTVLVAATGAVGGLLAMAGVFPSSGTAVARRARLLPRTAPPLACRGPRRSLWQRWERLASSGLRGSRYADAGLRSKRVGVSRPPRPDARSAVKRRWRSVPSPPQAGARVCDCAAKRTGPGRALGRARHRPTGGRGQPQRWGRQSSGSSAEERVMTADERARRVTLTAGRFGGSDCARELPRYLLCAVSVAGLAASARFAIAPPRPLAAGRGRCRSPAAGSRGRRLRGAVRAALPDLERRGTASEPSAGTVCRRRDGTGRGTRAAASGEQHVEWAEVVQAREPAPASTSTRSRPRPTQPACSI